MAQNPNTLLVEELAALAPCCQHTRDNLRQIIEQVMNSMRGDLSAEEVKLYTELESIAEFIHKARSEIAELNPSDIRDTHLPSASDELDAIVSATEEATGTILDEAEKIESLASKLPGDEAAQITNSVTEIYQACNFQDITGQRISKVIKALHLIEEKVEKLLEAFGQQIADKMPDGPTEATPQGKKSPSDKELMDGPQLPASASNQDDIDALFDSL